MYSPSQKNSSASNGISKSPEINITPLMDICLILLVTFMSVAPSIVSGIDVSVPSSNKADTLSPLASTNPITVSYLNDGSIYVDDVRVASAQMIKEVETQTNSHRQASIFIKADRRNSYGSVVALMEQLHRSGYTNTMLVTEPYKSK